MATAAPIASLDRPRQCYVAPYRGAGTECPGCGRSHWHVGRITAQCAFCATAIPLPEPTTSGVGIVRVSRRAVA